MAVHSEADWEHAVNASNIMFKGTREQLMQLDKRSLLEVLEGVPTHTLTRSSVEGDCDILSFLSSETGILPSKSEAKRSVEQNSISINHEKVALDKAITTSDFLNDEFILVQKGKKNKFLVIVE